MAKQKFKPKSKVEIGEKKKGSPKSLSSLLSQAGHTGPRFIACFKNQFCTCRTKQILLSFSGCQVTNCDCIWMQHGLTSWVSTVKEQLCLLICLTQITLRFVELESTLTFAHLLDSGVHINNGLLQPKAPLDDKDSGTVYCV